MKEIIPSHNDQLPLVSVGMVTYNSERYLKMSIESILSSTYSNFELIIFDDCSTDNTWQIINAYNDTRIRSFRNEKNLREYPNRLQCIESAVGKYFIFIDGDDYVYPHGLEAFVNAIEPFEKAGMVIARPESDHMIYPVELTSNQVYKYDFFGNGLTTQGFPSTMFRTETLKQVARNAFSIEYVSGDTFLKRKIAAISTTVLTYNGLSWWRRTPGQASEKLFKSYFGLIENIKMSLELLNSGECPLTESDKLEAKGIMYSILYRAFFVQFVKLKFGWCIKVIREGFFTWKYLFFKRSVDHFKLATSLEPLMSKTS